MTPRALYLFLHESAFLQPATGGQMIHSRPLRAKKEEAVSKLFEFMWTGLNVETSHRTAARLVAFQMLFRPVFQCS